MDIQSHTLRFRSKKRPSSRSNPLGLIGLLVAIFISIALVVSVIYGVMLYSEMTAELPPPDLLVRLLDPISGTLLQPTKIYDRTGQHILWEFENPLLETREYARITDGEMLFFQDVSEHFINAILAENDPEFFNKPSTFFAGIRHTASDPIPHQLVEELLLWNEIDHPYREVRIHLLSDQIVALYGREKVLEWYINSAYFGNQTYGIEQASQVYFGKPAGKLNLEEAALLAGVASFPALNPYDSPGAAKENQENILRLMQDDGYITRSELDRALQKELIYPDPEGLADQLTPSFVDYILEEADPLVPLDQLIRGGYKIVSTLDYSIQSEIRCTTELMISRVYGENLEIEPDCEASRLLPKYNGPLLQEPDQLEVQLVYLDPLQGEILGMSGINNDGDYARMDVPRDPGTLLTPFIYLNHFTQGFEPASLVWDIPLKDNSLNNRQMHPGCVDNCDYQGPINIRKAMINDFLSPAIQLWNSQGSNQVEKTLSLFGFSLDGDRCKDCTIFSESPRSTIIDISQGYGVFVNQGFLRGRTGNISKRDIQPASILEVIDLSGQWGDIEQSYIENKIISEQLVYLINSVLSDSDSRLYGDDFQIGRTAGVKTGFLPGSNSAWVIGYTPKAVTAVWAGSPESLDQTKLEYMQISTSLWRAVTQYTSRDHENIEWELPPGVITLDVCFPSGMLMSDSCPREVREIFIQGNQPQEADRLYQVLEINRETGLLASVFTPVSLIEEKVFIDIPPEAVDWAETAGLEVPPTLFDLSSKDPGVEGLSIFRPENLSFVNGKVGITGSLPELEFQSAKLQYGVGMNPGSWVQIGSMIDEPGENIWLGAWDTTELEDGVYSLQLILVKEDQRLSKISRILSVDNTSPEIKIRADLSEGIINYSPGQELLLIAEFDNSSEIDKVDFYLDNQFVGSRTTSPYLIPWMMQLGDHTLAIKAIDQAGNQSQLEVDFVVE
jgi:membrane carboxypeptidase/penicillin-binding protein